MSWFSDHFEKALLGGAVVLGLGLAYLGWDGANSVDEQFGDGSRGSGSNETSVIGADAVPKARQSLGLDRSWEPAAVDSRPVNLFTGIPLFIKSSDPDKALDLNKGEAVHPPIDNQWWLNNRLDPGFANSPAQDPDQDGYSNLEEFQAKTDPNNPASFPPLIEKLRFVKDISVGWGLRPGYGDADKFSFSYLDTSGAENRTKGDQPVATGDLFFPKGAAANRFKLVGSEVRKEVNRTTNAEQQIKWVIVEDQRSNKKGLKYEYPEGLSTARMNAFIQYDRKAVFTLEALGFAGKEFEVDEFTKFALPPDSKDKLYELKQVTPEKVVIEFAPPGGEARTIELSKGK